MAKKDTKQTLLGKTKEELQTMIEVARKELFNLRLDNLQRKLKNTSSLAIKRKEIARIQTIAREIV